MKNQNSNSNRGKNPNTNSTSQEKINSNENKEEILLKMLKAKKLNTNDITSFLRNNNLDLNKLDSHGYNLLHHAIKLELVDIVNLFLNVDDNYQTLPADPNIQTADEINEVYLNPLILALTYCNDQQNSGKIIKNLIKSGADYNKKDANDYILLHHLCEKGRDDLLEYLQDRFSANLNTNEDNKNTNDWNAVSKNGGAFHLAIIGDHDDTINYLLEKKIDFNLRDHNQNTCLHLSLLIKNFNVFKLILDFILNASYLDVEEKKKIFSAVNDEGNNILHELAYAQSSQLSTFIEKNNDKIGIDLELKNKQEYTYLEVRSNIIKLKKEREEMEKKKREAIREEKIRLERERKLEEENRKKKEDNFIREEEKREEFRLKILGYRNYIFVGVFAVLLLVLYIALDMKVKSKKREIFI